MRRFVLYAMIVLSGLSMAQGEEFLVPGENLVVDGLPPIPATIADDVRPYTEFRGASISSWHPTRREMLIHTHFADTTQIHHVAFPGGARTQLTFFKEPVFGASYQPTAGAYFIFPRDIGGNEFYQKYRFDWASGAVTLLTDGKARNTSGVWSNAGDQYVYSSTRRTGADVDLWIMNPANPESDRILLELTGGGWSPLDFSPDDQRLLFSEYRSVNESNLWLLDLGSGKRTLVATGSDDEKITYADGQFSHDGKGIYVTTDRGSEFRRLTYIDLDTKAHRYLTEHIPWDISSFELSWDGKIIAFITNEDGLGVLHLLDVASGKELPAPRLPAGMVSGVTWHRNNRDLGFSLVDPHRGSDAYSLDVTSGKVDRWTFSETGGVRTERFRAPELIRWTSFDGRMIPGWLHRPPAKFTGKRPVIVKIHGGPESQARPWLGSGNSYLVNEMGIAIIQPNIRGSRGYGKTFLTLDNGFKREDSYKDIAALFDWIESHPELDSQRIMITGGSYGGHMTLAISTLYPERIRCALPVVGMSNLVTFLENTSAYRRDLRRVEYGDERDPKMREFLNRIAPLNNAHKITKPMFIVQGANDPRVPRSESEQIVATLKEHGTPVWYLMAKDEGHGFAKKQNRDFQLHATVMFIRKYLLN